jgi:hypothetical protein
MPKRPTRKSKKVSGFQLLAEKVAQLKAEGLDEDAVVERLKRDENLGKAIVRDFTEIMARELARYAKGKDLTEEELKEVALKILEVHVKERLGLPKEPELH